MFKDRKYLDLLPIFFLQVCRMENNEIASILPLHWEFSRELHEDPSFASINVHEEVDDLVDVVRLLEHDAVLLSATRSFHSVFVHSSVIISLDIVLSNLRLTVSEDLLPLSIQESPILFILRVKPLSFLTLLVTYVTANNGFHRSIMTD